ncbi:sortase [Ruminococcus flavefaciens]|uniref:sortase n=1 Tax=Ruminococcus flavefaciens TaxID=1265 RepID=UPI0026ECA547|nr:sortase [Ruminococcus flavefaciens]
MRAKFRRSCIITGASLIFIALCMCVFNINESRTAAKRSQSALTELITVIEKVTESTAHPNTDDTEDDLFAQYEEPAPAEMPTVSIGDTGYCGYLTISELGLELPVINDFSYGALNTAPCRYSGCTESGDLIIAAHNFNSHFGRLGSLSDGAEIVFTDCSGRAFHYNIISIEEIRGDDVDAMLGKDADPWDMTLFTCTLSGRSRITVRAKLTY